MQRSKIVKKNNFKKSFLKKFLNFFKKNKNENSLEEVIKNFLNKRIKNKLPLKIDEEQIISNVFELPEKLISNIMIPRSDIISVDENSTLSELIKLIGRTNHSRYPVYEKNRDNIIVAKIIIIIGFLISFIDNPILYMAMISLSFDNFIKVRTNPKIIKKGRITFIKLGIISKERYKILSELICK